MLEEEIYGDNSPIWEADFTMPASDGTQLGHQTGEEGVQLGFDLLWVINNKLCSVIINKIPCRGKWNELQMVFNGELNSQTRLMNVKHSHYKKQFLSMVKDKKDFGIQLRNLFVEAYTRNGTI